LTTTSTRPDLHTAHPDWQFILSRVPLIYLSALIAALALNLFVRPADLAPGGVIGTAILTNEIVSFPISLFVLLGNVIFLGLGYRQLGGWNTVILTVLFVLSYSVNIELTQPFLPENGLSDERFLNAIYGGVVGGIAGGLVYRAGATMGGSTVLSRILHNRFGVPTSTAYLYVDTIVILAAALVFDWEASLFSLIVLAVDGFVADYVLEGPSLIRIVTIITDYPGEVSDAIMVNMNRGVTSWTGQGRYTNKQHEVLFVTVGRAEVQSLRRVVHDTDPDAFVVVGSGHVAYGGGFQGKGRAGRLPRQLQSAQALFNTSDTALESITEEQ
jgi:uncharacterized membrane-anchored protein YitT (DUF2179 family)